jgi:hypothetical protein
LHFGQHCIVVLIGLRKGKEQEKGAQESEEDFFHIDCFKVIGYYFNLLL